jgi:hypothetical protein
MPSTSRGDTQQQRLIERLREAGGRPVTFADLKAGGIDFPAAVAGELELAGYAVDRVYEHGMPLGLCLREGERRDLAGDQPRRRWPWSRRQGVPA